MLFRQRIRWGRGLIQLMWTYRRLIMNPKYKRLGLVTMPYTFLFEFLAPVIEVSGLLFMIYLVFIGGINWDTFLVTFFAIYTFSVMLSTFVVFYDFILGKSYTKTKSYLKLMFAAVLEPFIYHPLIVVSSLIGYYNFIVGKKAVWKSIKRSGMTHAAPGDAPGSAS